VVLKTCRTVCEKHAETHEKAGEMMEASFWRELAAGLTGELRVQPSTPAQPLAAEAGGTPTLGGGTSGMNIGSAVKHLDANAHAKPTGWCSKYVNKAIAAGGVKVQGANAKDLGPNLESAGFVPVATQADGSSYTPLAGDVVVFDAVPGHINGHTAMYNGLQWVSDFKQAGFLVAATYANGNYTIYRP
jgi:hypothetical protein